MTCKFTDKYGILLQKYHIPVHILMYDELNGLRSGYVGSDLVACDIPNRSLSKFCGKRHLFVLPTCNLVLCLFDRCN